MKNIQVVLLLAILATADIVHAHGIAGNRYFPGTLTFDDPAVADESILPLWSVTKRPADGADIVDGNLSWSFVRLLTPKLAIGLDGGFDRRDWGGIKRSGANQIHVTLKGEVYRDDPGEALVAASIAWGIKGSGSQNIGDNAPNIVTPGIFFGKGFGNLPENLAWLRPFGIAGAVSTDLPTARTSVNLTRDRATGILSPATSRYVPTLHWGFALEYSTYYLTDRFNGGPAKEEPLHQWVPLVEFEFDSPRGQKTVATMNPGLSYVADTWQIAVEAVEPLNNQSGRGVGARVQLLFFLDDLMPSLFGKPWLSR